MPIRVDTFADDEAVAEAACREIAASAAAAVHARGRFLLGLSGGRTPAAMLRKLSHADLPWPAIWVCQVDERVAPDGHADRNLTSIHDALVTHGKLPPANLLAMPVTEPDLQAAALEYESTLKSLAGTPPILDLVQLGLGDDGHTASLLPGAPLDSGEAGASHSGATVAVSGVYQGRRRLTLTLGTLNRARRRLWLVVGASKAPALTRLVAADASIPAGRVTHDDALVLTDLPTPRP